MEAIHPTSGIEIVLGDGGRCRWPEQEEIAIEYSKAHYCSWRFGQFTRDGSMSGSYCGHFNTTSNSTMRSWSSALGLCCTCYLDR